MQEEIDAVKLPSKTVFMPIGHQETLLPLAYKLREADLHLIAPGSLYGSPAFRPATATPRSSASITSYENLQSREPPVVSFDHGPRGVFGVSLG